MDHNQLADLKNIHLPHQVSIFPLAIGWDLIIAISILSIMIFMCWQFVFKKRFILKKEIYQLLNDLEAKSATQETVLSDVSILLKRVAITRFPELNPQTLYGEKWLSFLDQTGKTTAFTTGAGRSLIDTYKTEVLINPKEFFNTIKQWIRNVL